MKIVSLKDLEKDRIAKLSECELDERSIKKVQDAIKKRTEEQSEELGKQLYDAIITHKNSLGSRVDDVYNSVKRFIQRGANVNYKEPEKGNFALLICAMKGYTKLATLLIQAGADVNLTNNYGTTALMKASRHGNTDIMKMLIYMGADVNAQCSDGDTALFSAKMHSQDRSALLLIENQAVLNHMNAKGETLKDVEGSIQSLQKWLADKEEVMEETDVVSKAKNLLDEAKADLRRFGIDPGSLGDWLTERSTDESLYDEDVIERLPNGGTIKKPSVEQLRKLYEEKKKYNDSKLGRPRTRGGSMNDYFNSK